MKISRIILSAMFFAAVSLAAHTPAHAHEGKTHTGVSFAEPLDGATVSSEVRVRMRVDGMKVEPAGAAVAGAGHHHLIIDGDCIPAGMPVPKDATHKHFGKGQTETVLKLTPGEHTLTLQFANGLHQSYGPDWCHTIHVTVE